jgi:outer membrane protein TolC
MQTKRIVVILFLLLWYGSMEALHAQQVLTLKEAVQTALANYGSIRAKANYLNASKATATQAKRDYLPNLNLSAQQDYGTVNGQFGPSYGLNGLGVASSGPTLPSQNWNATFGGLYLANINWDFFAFGRAKERIRTAQAAVARDQADWEQEQFQQSVRVAGAYLNLLAAQRLTRSWLNNLQRADTFRAVVVTRALNGLIPGVDSTLANAEVSNARIAYTKAKDAEQTQANQLAQLMGVPPATFLLDTVFITRIPTALADSVGTAVQEHPLLKYYENRIKLSDEQARYIHTLNFPAFSVFGVMQTRGSGFDANYITDQTAYTHSYWDGVKPNRSNYLLGVGVTWNITSPLRVKHQTASQRFVSKGLQDEYELVRQQLAAQLSLSDTRIKNALDNYAEAPIQVNAATEAYKQRTVLYTNGLNTIVDVTQVFYTLNRAETDRDIAYTNVWQALLLKAAASGNFSLFINEF